MTLPNKFRNESERVIASYDYTDLAAATGFIKYYGSNTADNSSKNYILNTNATFSNDLFTEVNVGGTTGYEKGPDLDFDLAAFTMPQTIKGDALVVATMGFRNATSTYTANSYIIARVRKWDGSSETEIASSQSETYTESTHGDEVSKTKSLTITIPQTQFKVGDVLRLTIEVWGDSADPNNLLLGLTHSPQNLEGSQIKPSTQDSETTQLLFFCPFKLDL